MSIKFAVLTLLLFGFAKGVQSQDTDPKSASQEIPDSEDAKESAAEPAGPTALSFKVKSIEGVEVDLSKYTGNVLVIVNTASKCGMTPQYKQLQELHKLYGAKGVKVLGFPCNQFGAQEPGTSTEIKTFCTKNYSVTFDMFSKIDVNGEGASALYKYLNAQEVQPKGSGDVSWNFEKYVVNKAGKPIARFGSQVKPDSDEFLEVIQAALEQ